MTLRSCYIAYPIDLVGPASPTADWVSFCDQVDQMKTRLLDLGVDFVYDPGDAFSVAQSAQAGPEIAAINNFALDECEGVLAFLPAGVRTIGVPMEVARAAGLGKPVAVVTDPNSNSKSWSLAGAGVEVFTEAEAAVDWVVAQAGRVPVSRGLSFKVEDGGHLPTRAHESDAGFDLYVQEDTVVGYGRGVDVPVGVSVELPSGTYARLLGRSSTMRKRGLLVVEGVIDEGYRGPLFAYCKNVCGEDVLLKAGERVAQLILEPNIGRRYQPVAVPVLNDSPRGTNGYGSSGQ